MKKFMLVILAVVVAAVITFAATGRSSEGLIEKAQSAELGINVSRVEVYAKGACDDYTYTQTGAFNIYGCKLSGAGIIVANVDNILGTAVFYDAELRLSDVLEQYGAKSMIIQSGENCVNVYAYAKGCGYGVEIDGERVNMQIVLKDGQTVIGCPLVMGSY